MFRSGCSSTLQRGERRMEDPSKYKSTACSRSLLWRWHVKSTRSFSTFVFFALPRVCLFCCVFSFENWAFRSTDCNCHCNKFTNVLASILFHAVRKRLSSILAACLIPQQNELSICVELATLFQPIVLDAIAASSIVASVWLYFYWRRFHICDSSWVCWDIWLRSVFYIGFYCRYNICASMLTLAATTSHLFFDMSIVLWFYIGFHLDCGLCATMRSLTIISLH